MTYTENDVDQIIKGRCLPSDQREVVVEILSGRDAEAVLEELDAWTGHCYRFEPNHPRYDRNRAVFPRS